MALLENAVTHPIAYQGQEVCGSPKRCVDEVHIFNELFVFDLQAHKFRALCRQLGSNRGQIWNLSQFRGSLHEGQIGRLEQQFCWEVLYNLYVLHVGA